MSDPEFDNETYTRIYTAIADWWLGRAKLPEEVGGWGGVRGGGGGVPASHSPAEAQGAHTPPACCFPPSFSMDGSAPRARPWFPRP